LTEVNIWQLKEALVATLFFKVFQTKGRSLGSIPESAILLKRNDRKVQIKNVYIYFCPKLKDYKD
jgi:hypothetical protein